MGREVQCIQYTVNIPTVIKLRPRTVSGKLNSLAWVACGFHKSDVIHCLVYSSLVLIEICIRFPPTFDFQFPSIADSRG